jgi:PKD domain
MAVRLLRAAVIALAIVLAGSTAAAHAAAPPQFVTAQWLVRVPTGVPAGFLARAADPDGDAVTLAWTFDDGTTATGGRVAHAWTTSGSHTATVTATDATGLTASRTLTVAVVDAAAGPAPGAVAIRRPGPSPIAAARATLAVAPLRLAADGTVPVMLDCAPGAPCAGRVALAHDGRRLARAAYAVAAGGQVVVRLRLPAAAVARLRRRPARRVVVTLAPVGQAPVRSPRTLATA